MKTLIKGFLFIAAVVLTGCESGKTLDGATVTLLGTAALPVTASASSIVIPDGIAAEIQIVLTMQGAAFKDPIKATADLTLFGWGLVGADPDSGTYSFLVYGVDVGKTTFQIAPDNSKDKPDGSTADDDGQVSIPVTITAQK